MDDNMVQMVGGMVARHGLTTIAGWLMASGVVDKSGGEAFVGAGMLIAGVGWSWWQKVGHAKVKAELDRIRALRGARPAA